MAPAGWQWNGTVNIDTVKPVTPEPHVTSRPHIWIAVKRHAFCPLTNEISPASLQNLVGIPCPVAQGPAGTISRNIHRSEGIWEHAMETTPRSQRGSILFDSYMFVGVYFAAVLFALFLGRLFARCQRSLRRALDQMIPDPDAPWQATLECLEDDAILSTSHANEPTRWDDDVLTLCGEEDNARGQDGTDIEWGIEGESYGDRQQWYPSPPSSSSGEVLEEEGRRRQRSPPPLYWA